MSRTGGIRPLTRARCATALTLAERERRSHAPWPKSVDPFDRCPLRAIATLPSRPRCDCANLDRLQIVKGWLDAQGATHEKVFDVAWSDHRKPAADGRLPPVGNTVDLRTASYANSIGAAEFTGVFKDPQFDPAQKALYYARVIEIPTPRWTLFDAVRFKQTMDPKVPMTIQERAVSSPIWYSPVTPQR